MLGLAWLWFAVLRPQSLGGPVMYLVVRGDSMEPTFHGGDLIVVDVSAEFGVGDVVAYRVPEGDLGAGHLVLHRIVGGDAGAGYLLRGDNNPSVDPWMPTSGDVAGRARFVLAGVGRLLVSLRQPAFVASLAAALAVAWLVSRRRPTRAQSALPVPVPVGT